MWGDVCQGETDEGKVLLNHNFSHLDSVQKGLKRREVDQ